jgi:hypothetical protein
MVALEWVDMRVSKRQFLGMGLGGTAAVVLAPILRCSYLFGGPVILSPNLLESSVYSQWMKLSYGNKLETRQTRRNLGVALRHIGAIRGKGRGYDFTLTFDQAVEAMFQRWSLTQRKPASLFGLIQMLYDDYIFPMKGAEAGRILFCLLFSVLRGQEGTARGEAAHRSYLAYRSAALAYKNAGRSGNRGTIEETRKNRAAQLALWRSALLALADDYALRKLTLKADVPVRAQTLKGFEFYSAPVRISAPALSISRRSGQVVISWKGDALLQYGPSPKGPWSRVLKSTPAGFDGKMHEGFFRTIKLKKEPPQ